jgi:hypothetical protein
MHSILGADVRAGPTVGACVRVDATTSPLVYYDGFHRAFVGTFLAARAFFRIDRICHYSLSTGL